jgi:hypothetical protein
MFRLHAKSAERRPDAPVFHRPPPMPSVVDQMICKMFARPLDFKITFDGCLQEEKQKLYDAVQKNFTTNVSDQLLSQHYMLIFETPNGYSSKPLTP